MSLTDWLAAWAPPDKLLEFEQRFAGVHHYAARPTRCKVVRAARDRQIMALWDAGEALERIAKAVRCHRRTAERVIKRERENRRAALSGGHATDTPQG